MANKKIYQGDELLKTDDWGGKIIKDGVEYDCAGGTAVQSFVKRTFDEKWGCIYDNNKGKYYVFADEESRAIYLEHEDDDPMPPEIAALKLAEMNSYSNYRIVITLDDEHTSPTNAILLGQTGNEIVFSVDTYDKDDNPLLEAVNINYTITRPDGSKTLITHVIQTGEKDKLTVDNYLSEGQNTVAINVVGGTSNAVANTTVIYQVINLKITDSYDITKVHDVSDGKLSSLSITWSVTGSSTTSKFIEWYIDGVKQEMPDTIPSGQEVGRVTKNISIDAETYSEGRHNIQYRAWLTINEKRFYTPTYYKDFIVYNGGDTPIVATSFAIPIGQEPFLGDSYLHPVIYDMVQYTGYELPIAVFKNNTLNVKTVAEVRYQNGGISFIDVSYTNTVSEGDVWNATLTPSVSGPCEIRITAGDSEPYDVYTINTDINENELNLREIKAGLILDLRANGKSNSADDRDVWTYQNGSETYSTLFSGFTWDDTSGWNNNELVISNGNSIEINCKPLTSTVKDTGLAFEIEFSTFNVADDNAVICKIKNDGENTAGILITASEAIFNDNAMNTVSTKFKSNENNRITFVVDPESQGKPLMYIYVNGAACGAAGYSRATSSFAADKNIKIVGTAQAGIRIRQIRIYNLPLSADDVLNNYILYRNTYQEMKTVYDRNDVYADSEMFDLDKVSSYLPILLIEDYDRENNRIERLMNFTTVDKKTPILLRRVQYINNLDPTTNFVTEYAQMTCQGTSSMNYPIKNLRLYIKDKAKGNYGLWPLPITHTGTTMSDTAGTWTSKAGKGKISFKSGLDGTFSEGELKPQAVNCWTFKADYAESSSSHNTGVARLWNQVMRDAAIDGKFISRTQAQTVSMADPDNNMDVRTTVDGFPCVVFYKYAPNEGIEDTVWKFLGKYNFNNDKSTESVFGFCDINGIDYQEYEYEVITSAEYEEAKTLHPDDYQETTKNFSNVAELTEAVVNKTGKPAEELEPIDYVVTLCPTVYEYSKTYQKATATIAGQIYESYYAQKVMTSGDKNVKNYCVEVLENENTVTNFLADVSEFDSAWEEAFEFRYPEVADDIPDADTKGGLTNLRDFYEWCHSTMNTEDAFTPGETVTIAAETKHNEDLVYKQTSQYYAENGNYVANTLEDFQRFQKLKFEKEKWDYLDVFKMAAYYVYLMRFGAVDQVCKNAMFTTEGTKAYVAKTTSSGGGTMSVKYEESIGNHCKWFYINYDNDTILGLNNDGQLVYEPTIDRTTRTGNGGWQEFPEPTPEQIAQCIGEYDTLDDLQHAVEIGAITPQDGDMYKVGAEVFEWTNESGYAYAGHSSVLWNNLEADGEFMTIVSDMDNALYAAGLTYNNTIKMFNEKQADMWCEKILNRDAQKKYIDNYVAGLNHLGKMQGPRTSHRTWWLNKRFTYFDSKFISGEYKNKFVLFKADAPVGSENLTFSIMPTELMNYGWGITNRSNGQTGIPSTKDDQGRFLPINFDIRNGGMSALAPGDPVEIYATPYVSEIDLSNMAPYLMMLDLTGVNNDVLGSQLKRLILGKEGKINTGASSLKPSDLTGIEKAEKLEYIDMQGFESMTSLDLSNNPSVKEVYAFRSGLLALTLANGSKLERVWLPSVYNTLILDNVNYLSKDNIVFENDDMSKVTTLHIKNCAFMSENGFELLEKWYNQRNGNYANCVIDMEGIDWRIRYQDLDIIEELENKCESFVLKGRVTITDKIEGETRDETNERVSRIKRLFGENCFNDRQNPPVVVTCTVPFVIINATATEVTAKKDTVVTYTCDIYPSISQNEPSIVYSIVSGSRTGVDITTDDETHVGTLTTQEVVVGSTSNLTIRVTYSYQGSNLFTSDINLKINDPTYPSSANNLVLEGTTSLKKDKVYYYNLEVNNSNGKPATGSYDVQWSFSDTTSPYIDYEHSGIVEGNQRQFQVVTTSEEPEEASSVTLTAKVVPEIGSSVQKSLLLLLLNQDVILTVESNPVVMNACYNAGWTTNPVALKKTDAMAVTDIGTTFSGIKTDFGFNEFAEFENVTTIPSKAFYNSYLTGMTTPSGITSIGTSAFTNCTKLKTVNFDENNSFTEVPAYCFNSCSALNKLVLPQSVTRLNAASFGLTTGITKVLTVDDGESGTLVIPNTLTSMAKYTFEPNTSGDNPNTIITKFEIPDGITTFDNFDVLLIRGSQMKEFVARNTNINFSTPSGVLYNKEQQTLYKYPRAKADESYSPSESCLVLYDYAFYGTKLKYINFENSQSLRTIGVSQFEASTQLVSIDLSACGDLDRINNRAFYGCTKLENISFAVDRLRKFGTEVYYNNINLTEINIPDGVTEIGKNLIFGCNAVTEIDFPDSITAITSGTGKVELVKNCNSLVSIKFPKYLKINNGVNNICPNNQSLTGVTLPVSSAPGHTSLNVGTGFTAYNLLADGFDAYNSNLPNFVHYEFPSENDNNVYYAVDGIIYRRLNSTQTMLANVPCAITAITIPNTVKQIPDSCFKSHKVKNVVVPDSVTSMGEDCFQSCTLLETVVLGSGVTTLAANAFNACPNLKSFVSKSDSLLLDHSVFISCPKLSAMTFCALSVPTITGSTGVRRGLNPFGQIDAEPGTSYPKSRDASTFIGRTVTGARKVKVQYFTSGSTESIDLYPAAPRWGDPLFTPVDGGDTGYNSGCGFAIEYLTIEDAIYVKVYDANDEHYTYDGDEPSLTPYADGTVPGIYQSSGEYEGYYMFNLNADTASNHPVTFTMGHSGAQIGVLRPQTYDSHSYELHMNALSATRGVKGVVMASSDVDENSVSRYDYDRLVSRLNSLETKLKKMSEE